MQHDATRTASQIDAIAEQYDELIEDMVAHWGTGTDPQDAFELLRIVTAVNNKRSRDGRRLVTLPPVVYPALLDFCEHGRGKGRPRDSYMLTLQKQYVVEWARERKAELRALDKAELRALMKNRDVSDAETLAAKEAEDLQKKEFGIILWAAGTIKRAMENQSTGD
jgi:hypothetical protein